LKQVERLVGSGVTTDLQLHKFSKKLLGSCFIGVFPSDVKASAIFHNCQKNGDYYFIINVDGSNEPGSHWMAVAYIKSINKFIIYDSYARKMKKLIPSFVKTIGYKYIDANAKSDQTDREENCGARSISFLVFLKKYGLQEARMI